MKPSPAPANTLDLRQPPAAQPKPPKKWQWRPVRQRSRLIVLAGLLVAAGLGVVWLGVACGLIRNPFTDGEAGPGGTPLAALIPPITSFQPYQLELLDGFKLDTPAPSYANGVLIFELQNSLHQTIAVTEQVLPQAVINNVDPSAITVSGVDGSGVITHSGTTTTGALFSSSHHGIRTMVLLNTNVPIAQETMEDLLRGLRPASN